MSLADFDGLDWLEKASHLLDEAQSLEAIKEIRDQTEAARAFARASRLGLKVQNRAATLKLRAERKAGRLLASFKLRGGDRRSQDWRSPLKLADMGISRAESKRWQQLASVAETTFCEYLSAMNDQSRKVTAAGLLRFVRVPGDTPRDKPGRSACDHRTTDDEPSAQSEDVFELANHLRLLAEVLQGVFCSTTLQTVQPEVRVVGQLLAEMGDLIRKLTDNGDLTNAI